MLQRKHGRPLHLHLQVCVPQNGRKTTDAGQTGAAGQEGERMKDKDGGEPHGPGEEMNGCQAADAETLLCNWKMNLGVTLQRAGQHHGRTELRL